jgi:hypothetical protein
MQRSYFVFAGVAVALVVTIGASPSLLSPTVSSGGNGGTVVLPAGTSLQVSSSFDCVAGHYATGFITQSNSVLKGGFVSGRPGVTLYVATAQQVSSTFQGHPADWVFTTGLVNSTSFSVALTPGSYFVWIEGANMNCGSQIVTPLEELTTVNVTQGFIVNPK